jgi:hypothetical protein
MIRNEVRTAERRVEVGDDVVVHGAEGGVRPVLHTAVERVEDAVLEVGARVRGRDLGDLLARDLVQVEPEHVGFDAERRGTSRRRTAGRGLPPGPGTGP